MSLGATARYERDEFLEELRRRGFTVHTPERVVGTISVPTVQPEPIRIEIELRPGFPYVPPRVRPLDHVGEHSWHRERNGRLCLYGQDEQDVTWLDADLFLDRVRTWFDHDANGWHDDDPDLDLERYLPDGALAKLLVYGPLDEIASAPHVAEEQHDIYRVRPGKPSTKRRRRNNRKMGVEVVDVGELATPFHDWPSLADLLDDPKAVEQRIQNDQTGILLVRYQRRGNEGVVAVHPTKLDPLEIGTVTSASDAEAIQKLRAGLDREVLRQKAVAIVGVGAVGSFLADHLARAGVATLTVLDVDIVTPGNCVRHVLDTDSIGLRKVVAMQRYLTKRFPDLEVRPEYQRIDEPDQASELLQSHDLVVDATGAKPIARLLGEAAAVEQVPVVSVYLQRAGQVVRLDRYPLAPGEAHAPELPPTASPGTPLRESGCGEPVSPTPPWACALAAGLAAALVSDLLTARNEYPPSILQALRPQPDAELNEIKTYR